MLEARQRHLLGLVFLCLRVEIDAAQINFEKKLKVLVPDPPLKHWSVDTKS